MLVNLAQPACPTQNGERSFNDPSPRSHHEGVVAWLLAHNLDGDALLGLPPLHQLAGVPTIHPDVPQEVAAHGIPLRMSRLGFFSLQQRKERLMVHVGLHLVNAILLDDEGVDATYGDHLT